MPPSVQAFVSFFFNCEQKRKLVCSGKIRRLSSLHLGYLVGKAPGHAHALDMNLEHNSKSIAFCAIEHLGKHMYDELHSREIVVMDQNLVEWRFFQLLFTFAYYGIFVFVI